MRSKTILVVEDEVSIANLLQTNLGLEGYETVLCMNGGDALQEIEQRSIDLILLDVMLPDGNGIDICRKIKHTHPDIPVIMLSALGQSADRIKGLRSGADDYLPKPFDLEELLLRMRKLLDRSQKSTIDQKVVIGHAEIDFSSYTITRNDEVLQLTSKEALLLKYMIEKKGQVLSRQNILDEVWGFEQYPHTRTIDNFIATLRKYLEADPNSPKLISTVRGTGYKMNL